MLQRGETVQVLTWLFGTKCVVLARVVAASDRSRHVVVEFDDGERCIWPVSAVWPVRSK